MTKVAWRHEPEGHDYPAAADYLALVASPERVAAIVAALQTAPVVTKKAKDLRRAAGLPLLGEDDRHVASDQAKIRKGQPLSPVLVVRGDMERGRAGADRRRVAPDLRQLPGGRELRDPVPDRGVGRLTT